MSLESTFEKIASDRTRYSCQVETLGDCKIASPVRSQEFIREGERILSNENETLMKRLSESLGHLPTFERAGPHEKIFHDPSWTRVGIVTAGGLCPGLNMSSRASSRASASATACARSTASATATRV